ncbi:MAG: isochorismatase family protein [Myxococcales bacterium]|nr:isochorismatase family protein [Myxococcales bacterium]
MDALIIVDLQESSFRDDRYHDQDAVIERIERLAKFVRSAGGAIVFVQHDGTEEEGLLPFTPGWQILASLTREERDLVVRKTTNDAFLGTSLDHRLRELGAARLIVCGWATDFCVDSTIRAAISRAYRVVVVSDGHTAADRPHLSAAGVVAYHNWLWPRLLTPADPVTVLPAAALLAVT